MTNPVSVQLYSLRDLGSLDTILDAVVAAGYQAVELTQSHVEDAEATKSKLDARGLKASGAHIGLGALRQKQAWILEGSKLLGLHHVFMPAHPVDERTGTVSDWMSRGRELGLLARWMRSQGVRLGYHNHNWEFSPLADGSLPITHIFDNAGESLFLELDIAWVVRAGASPSTWLKRYSDRLLAVHVKDVVPEGQKADEGGWADVGSGIIDWKRFKGEALKAGAQWLVVEHDKPKDPAASIKASLGYLKTLEAA
ncbi:sugar phosphate isomerase/epimerase family protein [Rhizobium sp. CF142]|uniref:sugar phosphate isomerase/epimerase family protein n=1 Tax=Rhizobium sp. CF142 TaxID=1144314 RepID=UPI00026EF69D|nr:sugar phosphate isomerase/epimerase [Rhizobium sp. CF142]EJJ27115.1 sugar phosphate isomerase/epimerase [Rhizobium sp. CF142]